RGPGPGTDPRTPPTPGAPPATQPAQHPPAPPTAPMPTVPAASHGGPQAPPTPPTPPPVPQHYQQPQQTQRPQPPQYAQPQQPQYAQQPHPPQYAQPQHPQHPQRSPEQTAADITASWTSPWDSEGRNLEDPPPPNTPPPAGQPAPYGHSSPTQSTPAYGNAGFGSPSYGSPGYGNGDYSSSRYGSTGYGNAGYGAPPSGGYGSPPPAPQYEQPSPEYSPIFDQVASSWFDKPMDEPDQSPSWSSPADEGWSAAERLLGESAAPATGELPRREPMSQLVPGSVRPGGPQPFRMTRPESSSQDAWASYQDRVDEGRRSWPDKGRGGHSGNTP
ncbi:MAG: hypothetical protein ACRDYU_07210, partial [Actinomycetes bacterium]